MVSLLVPTVTVSESDGVVRVPLRLSERSNEVITITVTTADSSGSDFRDVTGGTRTVTFQPGETEAEISFTLDDDDDAEPLETIELNFDAGNSSITLPQTRSLIKIVDNDAPPTTAPLVLVDPVRVSESDETASFTLRLSAPSAQPTSVSVSTVSGSAEAGRDFQGISNRVVSFAPFETAKTVTVDITDDGRAEDLESFLLRLSNPSNATILSDEAVATIAASDQATVGTPSLTVDKVTVSENDGVAYVPLRLSAPSDSTITVQVTTADSSGSDFNDLDGLRTTVTFAPGETLINLPLTIYDDTRVEPNETVEIQLDPGNSPVRVPETRALVEIVDNDGQTTTAPLISARPIRVSESEEVATFAIQLSAPSSSPTTVDVSTVSGSARAGTDFANLGTQTVTFAPFDTVQTVEVDLFDEDVAEDAEHFFLALSNASQGTILSPQARATIAASDQVPAATPSLLVDRITVSEGDTVANVPLWLSRPSDSEITIDVASVDATGSDFNDLDGFATTVTFAPGETFAQVPFTIFNDDRVETREVVRVEFDPGDSPVFVPERRSVVELVDDDRSLANAPGIVAESIRVSEQDEFATFALRLTAPSNRVTTVDVSTVNGSAEAGSDFTGISAQTVTFAPLQTAQMVHVDLRDDGRPETAESFALALSNPGNATVLTDSATARIAASDQTPAATPILLVEDVSVSESDGVAQIPLRLSAPSDSVITVDVTTDDASGSDFNDIQGAATTVTFAPGQTLAQVPFAIFDDDRAEGTEAVNVTVDPGNSPVQVPEPRAILEIADNDGSLASSPNIVVDHVRVSENEEAVTFALRLTAPSNRTTTVDVSTLAGTASAGSDFVNISNQTVTFAPNDTAQTVTVDLIDDGDAEGAESFSLSLANAVNGTILTERAVATIAASDQARIERPSLQLDSVTVSEHDTVARVPIRLSAPSDSTVTARLATADGSASDFRDLEGRQTTITFAPGETFIEVPLPLFDDDDAEDTEVAELQVTEVTNGVVGVDRATVTIVNNDGTLQNNPELTITAETANEASGLAVFNLNLAAPSNRPVSVDVTTVNGSARAGRDFQALQQQTITFAPLDTSQEVRIDLVDDTIAEDPETLSLRVSNLVNATYSGDLAQVTIVDSDTGRGPNTPPVARDDDLTATAGRTRDLNVLSNDRDSDDDPLRVSELGDPANGSTRLLNDGTVRYTPDPGFIGSDSFDYTIQDGQGGEDSATVRVTVERLVLIGTPGADRFDGSAAGDRIEGRGGDDVLNGLAGNDTLIGGNGRDRLIGGDGNDTIRGGGNDQDLRDEVFAGAGDDTVDGGHGNDELRGDAGDDTLAGGFGVDRVIGGAGNDTMTGSAFSDLLFGGPGFDFVNGGFGFDRVNGGDGGDRFFHTGDAGHGSDWIQDYDAGEGDVLLYGGQANANQFRVITTETQNAGRPGVEEAFVVHTPTGQILWALVDGAAQSEINLRLGGQDVDLFA